MNKWLVVMFLALPCLPKYWSQGADGFLRINPTLTYKLNKKWNAEFDYRLTLNENMSRLRSNHYQTALSYKIIKPLSFEVAYRYTSREVWSNHRIMLSLSYKHKFEHFSISTRSRYQFTTVNFDPYFMNQVRAPRIYLRQKIAIKYPIPNTKTTIFAASEIFFRVRNDFPSMHRMRYQFGIEQDLKFGNTIGVRVIYENRVSPTSQDRIILTAKYDLSIDEMIKKIKKKKAKKAKKAAKAESAGQH